jgi:CRP-like cAMP-binding protein
MNITVPTYGSNSEKTQGVSLNCLVKNEFTGKKVIRQPKPIKVAILGPGEIFGDYEAFNGKDEHEFTVICTSIKGELLIFDKAEFIKKVASSSAILN